MRIGWKELVLSLIVVIVILQGIHLVLLTRLKYGEDSKKFLAVQPPFAYQTSAASAMQKIRRETVLDGSGEFAFVKNVVTGSAPISSQFDVTLVTQSSLHNLLSAWNLLDSWNGPASVAVFLNVDEQAAGLERILALRRCFPSIAANVSFHLVFPMRGNHDIPLSVVMDEGISCETVRRGQAIKNRNYLLGISYPVNLVRNVARQGVATSYFLMVDADMIVSANARSKFLHFVSKNSQGRSTAYVLPVFEIRASHPVPRTKADLINSWKKGVARAFYSGVCPRCQENTDYASWLKSPTTNETALLFEVMWRDPWEPFYIGESSAVPLHDERFRQYGFNRISQVCEMHVAGFSFVVLNDAFVVHKGWKTPDGFHPNKDVEQEKNRELFRAFKRDLKSRYGADSRRCY